MESDKEPRIKRHRIKPKQVILPIVALAFALANLVPVLYLFSASFMQPTQIFTIPLQLIPNPPRPQNFADVFQQFSIGHYLWNSVWVASTVVLLNLFFCSLTGYSLAKFNYPGRSLIFMFILCTMMIPFNVIVVPLYVVMRNLNWIDTPQALIAPFAISAFGVFLMRQFIYGIPDEYFEAARIDGAHEILIYLRIVIPLSKPALTTLAILVFVDNWDQLLWPLIVLTSNSWETLPLGLANFIGNYSNLWTLLMAASVVATLPVLFVFLALQRYFLEGLSTLGGIKG
jgi:ABC-type glycerol-3-phosphate transport system permease component